MSSTLMQPTLEYRPRPQFHATDWRAALAGGLVAGTLFLVLQAVLAWAVEGRSPWAPMQALAALTLGPGPTLGGVPVQALAIAVAIHLPLSLLYGGAIGWLVHRFDAGLALLAGLAFGLVVVYGLNLLIIVPTLFPWFDDAHDWITALPHAVFGVAAAAVYVALRRTDPAAR